VGVHRIPNRMARSNCPKGKHEGKPSPQPAQAARPKPAKRCLCEPYAMCVRLLPSTATLQRRRYRVECKCRVVLVAVNIRSHTVIKLKRIDRHRLRLPAHP